MDHYEILEVARDATDDEVKRAYRRLSSQHHPDREGGDPERMAAINRAYEVLGDPARRAEYDATGKDGSADALEVEARDRLVAVFTDMLNEPDDVDIALKARTMVTMTLSELRAEDERLRTRIAKLHRQRDRVRRKTAGENLFTGLVDSKLAELGKCRERAARGKQVFERVRDMLQEYEGSGSGPQIWGNTISNVGGGFAIEGMTR